MAHHISNRGSRSASMPPFPGLSHQQAATTYSTLQQLKVLVLGIVSVLDVLLCLLSSLLLGLLHICIKSLQETSNATRSQEFIEEEGDDGDSTNEYLGEHTEAQVHVSDVPAVEPMDSDCNEENGRHTAGQSAEQDNNMGNLTPETRSSPEGKQPLENNDANLSEPEATKWVDSELVTTESAQDIRPACVAEDVENLCTLEADKSLPIPDLCAPPVVLPDSNAPTYRALYENEVEINHRVVQEMIILRHKLEDTKLQRLAVSRALNANTDGSSTRGFENFSWSSPEMSFINESYEPEMPCGVPFTPRQPSELWRTRSLDAARTLTNTPSTMDFGEASGESDKMTQKLSLSEAPKEVLGSRPAVFLPSPELSPLSGKVSQGLHDESQGNATLPRDMNVDDELTATGDTTAPAKRLYDIVQSEELRRQQILESAATPPLQGSLDYADRLLEEIVVGRARLKPRFHDK